MFSPWEPVSWLAIPLRKSVNPFGGDLCFGWLEASGYTCITR